MSGKTGDCYQRSLTYNLTTYDTCSTNFNTWHSCSRLLPELLIIIKNNLQLLYCNYMLEKQQPCGQLVSGLQLIHLEHSRNKLALAEFTMLFSWTRHLTLTMPHSSNNITFGELGGTHTCKNKTLVFNCEDHFHFHRFRLFYLFKRFFSSQTQKEFSNITDGKSYFQAGQRRSYS